MWVFACIPVGLFTIMGLIEGTTYLVNRFRERHPKIPKCRRGMFNGRW